MQTYGGLNIGIDFDHMEFIYGAGTFGPTTEKRKLEDIRQTLRNPSSSGPETVYTIAMDIGDLVDLEDLKKRNLLYGACIYAGGRIGDEPVHSQGHIHAVSLSCGSSTPELYEIWSGKAYIFMQEHAGRDVKMAYAVYCEAGDKVIVPPGYAHYTVNADLEREMAFGAWCVRDYGFDYAEVRKQQGLMYFPVADKRGNIHFVHNSQYEYTHLVEKKPEDYSVWGLSDKMPIYQIYRQDRSRFDFVTEPGKYHEMWKNFIP